MSWVSGRVVVAGNLQEMALIIFIIRTRSCEHPCHHVFRGRANRLPAPRNCIQSSISPRWRQLTILRMEMRHSITLLSRTERNSAALTFQYFRLPEYLFDIFCCAVKGEVNYRICEIFGPTIVALFPRGHGKYQFRRRRRTLDIFTLLPKPFGYELLVCSRLLYYDRL